jgi:glycerol-3-phosphate dehydrogenase (NAD(P)+)
MNGEPKHLAVLGAGSFGTALAVHLAGAGGHRVRLWARNAELAQRMAEERVNREYLEDVTIPSNCEPTSDIGSAVGCDAVILAAPSHGFRDVLRLFLQAHPGDRPVHLVSAAKGIETETLARMSQVAFEEAMAADRDLRFAVLSGPTFAAELARGMPTTAVIASEEAAYATLLREMLSTPTFRLYSSSDVPGVELGGSVKNVIAIAAGTASGLGLGSNTLAALITRGLHEITRLGIAYGGQPRTFAGLAGLGDLVLTCTGSLSRNRRTGLDLAAGKTLAEITGGTHFVSEGIRNSIAVARVAAARGVEMPITEQMVQVMYEGKSPRKAVEELMTRGLKSETEL